MSQHMRQGYLSHRRPVNAKASLRISTVSPEPLPFAFEEPQTGKP